MGALLALFFPHFAASQDWKTLSWGDSRETAARSFKLRETHRPDQFALGTLELAGVRFVVLATFSSANRGLARVDLASFELLVRMRSMEFAALRRLLENALGSADIVEVPPPGAPRDGLWSVDRHVKWFNSRTTVTLDHVFAPIWAESQTGSDILTLSYEATEKPYP